MNIALLHIYPQAFPHEDAQIIGNAAGLKQLRDAINAALADTRIGKGVTPEREGVFANDGEGYQVQVILDDSDWLGASWCERKAFYTDLSSR